MEQVNIFTNGMDMDSSPEFMQQGAYRYMLNGDIITESKGGKAVAINDLGNKELSIIWPNDNLEAADAKDPYNSNWIISKGLYVRNDLILIYKDMSNTGNTKIDLLKYVVDNLYKRIHLLNEVFTDIGFDNKVDGFVNYESPEVIKLYFYSKSLQGNTKIKHLNIAPDLIEGVLQDAYLQGSYVNVNSLTSFNLDILPYLGNINLKWYNDWTLANYKYISGNLRVGMYTYYYRSIENSVVGEWIQLTYNIPISNNIDKSNIKYQKGEFSTNDTGNIFTSKGIKLIIRNTYEEIQVARAWYSELRGIPEVAIIYEGKETNVLDINYDKVVGMLDFTEFNILKPFISPKTHSIKDNTLFLGNIEEDYFDVEYDARAYRFDSGGIAKVINNEIDEVYIDASTTWKDQVKDFDLTDDLVNPFNTDITQQYKYQSDGSTIGGEGINVKYSIEVVEKKVATDVEWSNELEVTYSQNTILQLDEIYRFGVVFYDKYLRRSPVKWIGDIRMPRHHEIVNQVGNDGYIRAMGAQIQFEIHVEDYPELQDASYRLVMVERKEFDRTVLYEGIGSALDKDDRLPETLLIPSSISNNPDYTNNTYKGLGSLDNFGTNGSEDTIVFYNPEISFFKNALVDGLSLEFIGYLDGDGTDVYYNRTGGTTGFQLYLTAGDSGIDTSGNHFGDTMICKLKYLHPIVEGSDETTIIDTSILLVQGQESVINEIPIANRVFNWIEGLNSIDPDVTYEGEGGTTLALKVDSVYLDYIRDTYGDGNKERVAYFRIKRNVYPYGGGSYASRKNSIYVAASGIQITDIIGSGFAYGEVTAFGDTFLGSFEFQRVVWKYESVTPNFKLAETVIFPVASSINLQLRQDDTCTTLLKDSGDIGLAACEVREEGLYLTEYGQYEVDFSPLYLYNSVYSQIASNQYYIERDYDKSINNKFDTKLIYSDTKILGEKIDSFLQFKPNNFNTAHNEFGAINYMVYKNGNVYVFQDAGFSLARINIRTQIQQDDGTVALMGIGNKLDGFTYISDSVGIQKLNEASTSLMYIYFLDINKKKLYRFAQALESLSDFNGLSGYLNNTVNENTEFIGMYDNKTTNMFLTLRNEVHHTLYDDLRFSVVYTIGSYIELEGDLNKVDFVIGNNYELKTDTKIGEYEFSGVVNDRLRFNYTALDILDVGDIVWMDKYIEDKDSITIKFNEYLNKFISFMSFIPSFYIKGFKEFYSSQNSAKLYKHNVGDRGKYYDVVHPFIVSFVVNGNTVVNKQMDAFSIETKAYENKQDHSGRYDYLKIENKTFNEIMVKGDRGSTEFINIYLKDSELPTEFINTEPTDNFDSTVYTNTERNIYESNGVRIVPYPNYAYNCRMSLNSFNIAAPRLKTKLQDNDNKRITERLRGKTFEVKLIYNNTDNIELRLFNVISYFSTSINL